ncbi:MAG: DUF1194 domain-containing protein [Acidobacteria bacterium]|nr:DUF1194 domain-containing protein [Acidobacteriota bacterium]
MELALVIDASTSISSTDFALQKQAYVDAFSPGGVVYNFVNSGLGTLAASAFIFGGNTGGGLALATQVASWTGISNGAESAAFAAALSSGLTQPGSVAFGNTNIGAAVNLATGSFATNGFEGLRLTIDISSDGLQNLPLDGTGPGGACPSPGGPSGDSPASDPDCVAIVQNARNAAAAAGITINALAIPDVGAGSDNLTGAFLSSYYTANLITPGGFVVIAETPEQFATTLNSKLQAELSAVPEPGTLLLFGSGAAMMFRRLRNRRRDS